MLALDRILMISANILLPHMLMKAVLRGNVGIYTKKWGKCQRFLKTCWHFMDLNGNMPTFTFRKTYNKAYLSKMLPNFRLYHDFGNILLPHTLMMACLMR